MPAQVNIQNTLPVLPPPARRYPSTVAESKRQTNFYMNCFVLGTPRRGGLGCTNCWLTQKNSTEVMNSRSWTSLLRCYLRAGPALAEAHAANSRGTERCTLLRQGRQDPALERIGSLSLAGGGTCQSGGGLLPFLGCGVTERSSQACCSSPLWVAPPRCPSALALRWIPYLM